MGKRNGSKVEVDVGLSLTKPKRPKSEQTDYNKCVICQSSEKNILNVQKETASKLRIAAAARCDDVADRLGSDIKDDSWLGKNPKWHNKCRNWYINRKSYQLVQQRRLKETSNEEQEASSSTGYATRSRIPCFKAKKMCVVCGKEYYKKKKSTFRISTKNREDSVRRKANFLDRKDILLRLEGQGHDMVANDICYHKECMNKFMNVRIKTTGKSIQQALYDKALAELMKEIETPLFTELQGYMVRSLRERFCRILQEKGVENSKAFRSSQLKVKLNKHFGQKIAIIEETSGSGFVCAANVPLGDALANLAKLEKERKLDRQMEAVIRTAKILRQEAKACKKQLKSSDSMEMSAIAASQLVPDCLFNFSACLITDKGKHIAQEEYRFHVDPEIANEAILISQQLLQHGANMPTPLGTATALHLYSETRSKSLITLSNRLGQGMSYDRLQRQLTAKSISVMQQEEEDGVFIPENISRTSITGLPHVFAIDNLDWKKKTLQGGSFHVTTAIVIDNALSNSTRCESVSVPIRSSARSLESIQNFPLQNIHVTDKDRRKSRSLEQISSLESLQTECDGSAENMLLVWKLTRVSSATSTLIDVSSPKDMIPGFSACCSRLLPVQGASRVGYFPLIPESPTNPAVLQLEMKRLVKASHLLNNEWTIIAGDQATYELARVIREKEKDTFDKVILLLGGFHQAHNYLKAVCKVMRDSGAEIILTNAGLCEEGTARKIFGERAEYYQTLHAIQLLNEAMWQLFYRGFEEWCIGKDCIQWADDIWEVIQRLLDNTEDATKKMEEIRGADSMLTALRTHIDTYKQELNKTATAQYWLSFLDMSDILLRFLYYQREGNWLGHLHESANMLPYLTAAGHYKYGQQSLPQYLLEMKQLQLMAPHVYHSFMQGNFVARRSDGSHNGVSPDMLLEQTYNAEAKETSGLDGIAMKEAARAKWVYTKPLTAAASFHLKSMLDMNAETQNPHHESGKARISRDIQMVQRITEAVQNNPFSSSSSRLLNIATGQVTEDRVQSDLLNVKEVGNKALLGSIQSCETRKSVVKLQTFHVQSKKKRTSKQQPEGKSNEIVALMRMTQIAASGGNIDVVEWIGKHECADSPPSLFDENGSMRATGTKSTLVKVLKLKTGIDAVSELPIRRLKTAVIIDAMYVLRRWSFQKDIPFPDVVNRYKNLILKDVPQGTEVIHLCCDRYNDKSLKSGERSRRGADAGNIYEVSDTYNAPDPKEFFKMSENKAALLDYLCRRLVEGEIEKQQLGDTKLYLAGGFEDCKKSVMVSNGCATDISDLSSTQEEADTRIILHSVYTTKNDGVQRIIIHANDTDVVVLSIHYFVAHLRDLGLQELWIRTDTENYLPIHEIASSLDDELCHALPFVHSLSGRDTTSYPYYTGKKSWLKTVLKCSLIKRHILPRMAMI